MIFRFLPLLIPAFEMLLSAGSCDRWTGKYDKIPGPAAEGYPIRKCIKWFRTASSAALTAIFRSSPEILSLSRGTIFPSTMFWSENCFQPLGRSTC